MIRVPACVMTGRHNRVYEGFGGNTATLLLYRRSTRPRQVLYSQARRAHEWGHTLQPCPWCYACKVALNSRCDYQSHQGVTISHTLNSFGPAYLKGRLTHMCPLNCFYMQNWHFYTFHIMFVLHLQGIASVAAATLWNSLPIDIREAQSQSCFHCLLKRAYPDL